MAPRWLQRLGHLSRAHPLLLAWLVCLAPRLLFAATFPLAADYTYFLSGRTSSYWYPAYEAFATLMWKAVRGHLAAYVALHAAIHACIGPLVHQLSRLLGFPASTAWLGVLGVATLPYYVSLGGRQPQPGIVIPLLAAVMVSLLLWMRSRFRFRLGVSFCVLSAALISIRPNAALTVAAFLTFALLSRAPGSPETRGPGEPGEAGTPGARRAVALSGALIVVLLAVLAVLVPHAGARFSLLPGYPGLNLYMGNNPHVSEFLDRHDIDSLQATLFERGFPDGVRPDLPGSDERFRRAALEYMAAHPWQTLRNTFFKAVRYWDYRLDDADLTPWYWNLAYTIPALVYGGMAVMGAAILWRRREIPALGLLGAAISTYWLPHAITFGAPRMRMTTEFLLVILSAVAVRHLANRVVERRRFTPAPAQTGARTGS